MTLYKVHDSMFVIYWPEAIKGHFWCQQTNSLSLFSVIFQSSFSCSFWGRSRESSVICDDDQTGRKDDSLTETARLKFTWWRLGQLCLLCEDHEKLLTAPILLHLLGISFKEIIHLKTHMHSHHLQPQRMALKYSKPPVHRNVWNYNWSCSCGRQEQ